MARASELGGLQGPLQLKPFYAPVVLVPTDTYGSFTQAMIHPQPAVTEEVFPPRTWQFSTAPPDSQCSTRLAEHGSQSVPEGTQK